MSDSQAQRIRGLENRLRKTEELVRQATQKMGKLKDENTRIREKLGRLIEENGHLELQFRRFKSLSQRQERLRGRLEGMVKKLDKVIDIAS